jgi:hypothetical protein
MAIKIRAGMLPRYGRITMPKGTYLSNPSTAADGLLGGGGTTPPVPGDYFANQVFKDLFKAVVPQLQGITPQKLLNPMGEVQRPSSTSLANIMAAANAASNPVGGANGLLQETQDWLTGTGLYGKNPDPLLRSLLTPRTEPTSAFKQPPKNPTNNLVGNSINSSPNFITHQQIQAMFGNLSAEEVAKTMAAKGYTSSMQAGVGLVWVKTGESAPASQLASQPGLAGLPQGSRVEGNPYEIGAQLAPGQRVMTAGYQTDAGSIAGRGIGVTGGTPYTNQNGETVSQYAVTYGGKGDRWKSRIQQDNEGNWVKIYYRTFSKARSRSALKRKANLRQQENANRRAAQQQPTPAPAAATPQGGYDQQLVTMRADYG